jgi:hypothetical protein
MNPATIIRNQIGKRALFMIGAKDLWSENEGRTFRCKVGRNAKGVNLLQITLADDDTYTVKFSSLRRKKGEYAQTAKVIAEVEGVHVDSLHATIEEHTGMVTTFPTIIRSAS